MRLYRYSDMVGNANIIALIRKSLQVNAFPKVSIMEGLPGTGKSTSAEIAGLTLTCLHPINGEPCLECDNCKKNVRALKTTGESINLIKKNMGILNSRKDILDLIKEIFILKTPVGNNVYILEEPHVLKPDDQTALLEEIDRLGANTYIIFCTTESHKLIRPLRRRAREFEFKALNDKESTLLFAKTCQDLKINRVSPEVTKMIQRYARGIPAIMVELVDFINKTKPSHEQIMDFLGVIDTEEFSNLFFSMFENTAEGILVAEELFNNYSYDKILTGLKEYVLQAVLYKSGKVKGFLTKNDRTVIDTALDFNKLFKISKMLENTTVYNTNEVDFKLKLLSISTTIQGKPISSIITENSANASLQKYQAETVAKENKVIENEVPVDKEELTEVSFMNFFP